MRATVRRRGLRPCRGRCVRDHALEQIAALLNASSLLAADLSYLAILAPVAEELVLRGATFARANATLGPAGAILVTRDHFLCFELSSGFPLATTRRLHPGERRDDLGRVGGRAGRSRSGLRQAVALLGEARRRHGRPDRLGAG